MRGAFVGALTAYLALAMHVFAGGIVPSALAIAASFAMSIWISAMIAVLGASRWLITVAIVASQLTLHWIFSASTGAAQFAAGGHGHGLAIIGVSQGHAMWWAHVLAGALTLIVVLTASRLSRVIAAFTRLVLRSALIHTSAAAGGHVVRRPVPAPERPGLLERILLAEVLRRGPPVAV